MSTAVSSSVLSSTGSFQRTITVLLRKSTIFSQYEHSPNFLNREVVFKYRVVIVEVFGSKFYGSWET